LTGLPRLAGAWSDLNPGSRTSFTNTLPVQALGFAGINQFVVRWINVPTFSGEACASANSFTIALYDAGTGLDQNASQPLNPANPIGNNAVPFDLQQGPTDLHYVQTADNLQPAGYNPRPAYSGNACMTYGRMDLLGATDYDDTLVGATPGGLVVTTTPGINLSAAALAGDLPFPAQLGVAITPQVPGSPYEYFTAGTTSSYTVTDGITTTFPAVAVFDLRQEGHDAAAASPVGQPDANRGQVCYYTQANQTINFTLPPAVLALTSPLAVTATATSGLPVAIQSLTPSICTVAGYNINLLAGGTCILRAGQSGNSTYAPALYIDRAMLVLYPYLFLPLLENG
jgi:hypothetical protein